MHRHPGRRAAAPSALGHRVVLLFAMVAGVSVANVYYAQPLLDVMADDLGMRHALIGGVVTATQVGSALALLLLVPLGDLLDRRRMMSVQLALLVGVLALVCMARSPLMLFAGMLGVGLLGTAMTQGAIAYAASAASAHQRGRVVGAAQGGVLIGVLLARVFSGAVGDLAGWRAVYAGSALLMLVVAAPLRSGLPRVSAARERTRYLSLLGSMFALLRDERVLRVRGMLALLLWAAFNIFWSALVLPLSAPPYGLSHTQIGAFGLIGAVGAWAATRAGRWADHGLAERTSAIALIVLLLAWWPLAAMASSWWLLGLGIVLLDVGCQALHVTNQSMIFRIRPEAHSRLVGLYMLFYAVGSGLGALAATAVYARAGWHGVCVLGAAVSLSALLFWAATRKRGAPASAQEPPSAVLQGVPCRDGGGPISPR